MHQMVYTSTASEDFSATDLKRLLLGARTRNKAPDSPQGKPVALQPLSPAQGEVARCRAEELEQRRGLPSAREERWSAVGKQAEPRWLGHAIDPQSGTVLA